MASVSIGVFARFKPLKKDEERAEFVVSKRFGKQKSVQVRNLEFSLDWIFDVDATQEQIFEIAAKDRAATVLEGFNAAIMAYGQTGSGKTFSMFGPDETLENFAKSEPAQHGVVPRAAQHVFDGIGRASWLVENAADICPPGASWRSGRSCAPPERRLGSLEACVGLRSAPEAASEARVLHWPWQASEGSSFMVTVTYLEVYNDKLNDLLGGKQNCPLRETPKGILVEGLGHEVVTSVAEVMAALQRGSDKRMVDAARSKPPSTQSLRSARLRPRRR